MKMIFETPATVWQEAFPLGNGRIGALMFGDGEAETLCLNEDTLWSGYPGDPRTGISKKQKCMQKRESIFRLHRC